MKYWIRYKILGIQFLVNNRKENILFPHLTDLTAQKFRLNFIACLLVFPYLLIGQQANKSNWSFLKSPEFTFTISDGLPADEVNCMAFDDMGCVWIGTVKGLCKWDGTKLFTYTHKPEDSATITGDFFWPNALKYDPFKDRILAGTENGLSILNPKSGRTTNYYKNEKAVLGLHGAVFSVYQDYRQEIWLGTDNGLYKFDENRSNFQHIPLKSSLITSLEISLERLNTIHDMAQDEKQPNILWLATLEGLVKYNTSNGTMKLFRVRGNKNIKRMNEMVRMVFHKNKNLYIGTWNFDLSIFSTELEQFTSHIGPNASIPTLHYDAAIIPLKQNTEQEIWVGSIQGLGILNTQTLKIDFVKTFVNQNDLKLYPKALAFSPSGNWYIGTDYGLQYYNRQQLPISNFFFDPSEDVNMYLTNCLFEDKDNDRLYIGYKNGDGLHYFDLYSSSFQVIPLPRKYLKDNNVLKIIPGKHADDLWILTIDGLFQLDKTSNKFIEHALPELELREYTDMILLDDHRILISDAYHGIWEYNFQTNEVKKDIDWIEYFRPYHDRPNIIKMTKDDQGRVWFSRYGGSYGYFNPNSASVTYFDKPGQSYDVKSFFFDADTVWMGTSKRGMGFIDPFNIDQGLNIKYSSETGLSSDFIQGIEKDNKGRFWLLTTAGLECLDPEFEAPFRINENYGLRLEDDKSNKPAYLPGRLLKLSNGRMIVGYRRGIGIFDPEGFEFSLENVQPYLNELLVFDKTYTRDSVYQDQNKIVLKHNENYLTFNYSALNPDGNKSFKLQHKLEGVDLGWIESKEQMASYPKLAPGDYRFIIRLTQSSGFKTINEKIYTLSILPPWWNTAVARGGYVLITFFLIYAFYEYQLRRKLLINETQSLKSLDELKTKLYTNITHEFRTPLTIIMGIADELKEKTGKALDKEIHLIKRNSNNLLLLVNQMLDMQKLDANSMPTNLIQGNLIPFLSYVVHSFTLMAERKNIQLQFMHEDSILIMDYDPEKMQNILSNLLSNAIKYTPEKGSVIIKTSIKKGGSKLAVIEITDTGIGIPKSSLPYIFDRFYQVEDHSVHHAGGTGIGLALTNELVKLLKGDINVKSKEGQGSTFFVSLPITNNALLQKEDVDYVNDGYLVEEPVNSIQPIDSEKNNGSVKPMVLITEDNQDMMDYLKICLSNEYKLISAYNGVEGLSKAINYIPDIVISDVMMPEMDGLTLLGHLKKDFRTSHIPVVLLTAKADQISVLSGLEGGAEAYITKPFHKQELLIRIKKLIETRRKLQERYLEHPIAPTSDRTIQREDVFINKLRDLIKDNLGDEDFDVNLLAKFMNMSRAQLYRKFQALTDLSIGKYIRIERLKKAKELLLYRGLNVTEAAFESGFRNLSHFSTAFKEEFGVSPKDIRG